MAKYDLDTLRHSSAHLMAQAIMELFPNESVQLGIGPTIENGFYYDIEMNAKLTEENLKQIEEKMKEIIKRNLPIVRHEVSRAEALKLFAERGQTLKCELIKDIPDGEVISKSYNARPAVKLDVFAAVIDKVISPLAVPVTVAVKLLAVVE